MWIITETKPWYVCYLPDGKMLMTLKVSEATVFPSKAAAIKALSRSFKDPDQVARKLESGPVEYMGVIEIPD